MEIKKSPSADLEPKKSYFFEIGLIVALLVMIGAFSWSQPKKVFDLPVEEAPVVVQDFTEITVQEDKRPPAPAKTQAVTISDVINIVKNDTKISQDLTMFDLDMTQDLAVDAGKYGGTYTGEGVVEDEEVPVLIAEEMPKFQGGDINTFRKWCQENLKYPPIAADNGVQGRVSLSFVIERDGSVSNVKVMRGADKELDNAAIKIISSSPKWAPGKNRGKAVRVTYNMPIDFVISAAD